ncbi:bolA family protein [Heterostelium album PN500]|uniref:BolA family protein n=1 Tax=Heterostelium pallidum (strain ATCC 26659 / Pp 5 / PN500) TaxID=670386 RepID=D3B3Z9_HETP5|nr:bolA family protein [Heterostelium album PN500]EFA84047.1 bolA family protein [Heterostelium album PN500]|eukprot:XP_020436164.1 bolA family protein [Heterostelium album PN500]
MTVTVEQLENTLKSGFPDSNIIVEDVSGGCGAKFSIVIGSDKFEGVSLLERHRMANDVIGELMKDIHAINFKTWTKKQYEEKMKQ